MTDKPLVSIVIPYYDHTQYLPDTVCSALAQTYANVEIIVVDDCGPTNAREVLADRKFENVRIVNQSERGGSAKAKNTGVSEARGSFIIPLDSDDLIEPTYVETAEKAISGSPFGGVFTQTQVFGLQNFVHSPDCTLIDIMCGFPAPTTFMYRKELFDSVGGYNSEIHHDDDEFWLSALEKGWKFLRIDEPLYRYRKHSDGKSADNRDLALASFAREHKELYSTHLPEVLQKLEGKYFGLSDQYEEIYAAFHTVSEQLSDLKAKYLKMECERDALRRKSQGRLHRMIDWLYGFKG